MAAAFTPLEKVIVSKGKCQAITKSGKRDGQCPTASDVQSKCKKSSKSSSEAIGRTTSLHCRKHLKVCTTAITGTETKNVNKKGKSKSWLTAILKNVGWRHLRWHRQRAKAAKLHPRKIWRCRSFLVTQTESHHLFPKSLENFRVLSDIRLFTETQDTNLCFNRWQHNQKGVRAIRKQCVNSLLGLSLHAYDNVSREGVNLEMCIKIINLRIEVPHHMKVRSGDAKHPFALHPGFNLL